MSMPQAGPEAGLAPDAGSGSELRAGELGFLFCEGKHPWPCLVLSHSDPRATFCTNTQV